MLRMSDGFWTRGWVPLGLTVLVFLGELPWIILMDSPEPVRSIYGFSALRVYLAHAVGTQRASLNAFGWAQDMEKIVPWTVALFMYLSLRRIRKVNTGAHTRLPRWVCAWALVGAILISFHYADPDRGHYTSYEDKGLIDALQHIRMGLGNGDSDMIQWVALACYRVHYLLLAPWMYWVIFATAAAATVHGWRVLRADAPFHVAHAQAFWRLILLTGVPALGLFLIHDVATGTLGYDNYNPSSSRRQWLIYAMYAWFLVSSFVMTAKVWSLARGGDRRLIRILVADVRTVATSVRDRARSYMGLVLWALMLLFPAARVGTSLLSPSETMLNRSLARTASFFTTDYTDLARRCGEFDALVGKVVYDAPVQGVQDYFESPRSGDARAMVLATVTLLRLGIAPSELQMMARMDSISADQVARDHAGSAIKHYWMFESSPVGREEFLSRLTKLLELWRDGSHNQTLWKWSEKRADMEGFVSAVGSAAALRPHTRW